MGAKVCRRWTQEERDYVEDKWGLLSVHSIAKQLNRSYNAIQRYAEKNKLGGSCFNDLFYTTVQVGEMLNVDQTTVIEWITSKKLKATTRKLRGRKVYLVEPKDFEAFKETYKPKNYSVWTILQERRLVELVKEGKTNKEIALIMDKTEKSVRSKRTRLMRKEREKNESNINMW